MKHTELVDKYDAQVDALEVQFRDRGLTEEQTEPFFFQLRTQTFFFARLDDLSIDAAVQDELYDHYNQRQTTIEAYQSHFREYIAAILNYFDQKLP